MLHLSNFAKRLSIFLSAGEARYSPLEKGAGGIFRTDQELDRGLLVHPEFALLTL